MNCKHSQKRSFAQSTVKLFLQEMTGLFYNVIELFAILGWGPSWNLGSDAEEFALCPPPTA